MGLKPAYASPFFIMPLTNFQVHPLFLRENASASPIASSRQAMKKSGGQLEARRQRRFFTDDQTMWPCIRVENWPASLFDDRATSGHEADELPAAACSGWPTNVAAR